MKFAQAHKVTTYLMVVSAWMALMLSGELGPLIVLGSLVAIVGSWWWEAPRIHWERWAIPWTVLSALMLAYTVLMAIAGDFLIAGAECIVYLVVAKLFNRRRPRDYQQIYTLTFLMLVAGTVLNSELTYGACFLLYVVTSTWALILFHLRREMEDNFLLKHSDEVASERVEVARILGSRRVVGGRFFAGTALVAVTVFALATMLFLLIPRIGFGLFFQKSRGGITLAGFSDGVRLDGHGTIKDDTTVVMRVEVGSAYEGRRAPYLHWRGVAFDHYENGVWSRSAAGPMTERQVAYVDGRERHHLQYDRPWASSSELADELVGSTRQVIYLEPIGYDVVFGASMPIAFEFEPRVGVRTPRRERNDEIRFSHEAGTRYVAYSRTDPPAPDELRAAAGPLPPGYDAYLQLPIALPQRVRDLAQQITAGATTNYDRALAIQSWLRDNLTYTLEMVSPGDREPVDFFLFDRRRGHCEYFSSAFSVLARAVGVPVRNVNGFLGGEWNEYDGYIAVRAGDAHSWAEAYFPGIDDGPGGGWVTFDATPSAEVDRMGRGGAGWLAKMRRWVDTLRFKWFKWVIEYDLHRQLAVFRSIGNAFKRGANAVKATLGAARDWVKHNSWPLGGAALLIAGGLGWLAWRRRRRGSEVTGGRPRGQRRRSELAAIYAATVERLARRGLGRAPSLTPREHARQLADDGAPGAAPLGELAELYYQAEYGGAISDAMIGRAQALRREVDLALRDMRA